MTLVRFAMLCDKCGKRSPEYATWASCPYCCDDVCPDCAAGRYPQDDEKRIVLCRSCADAEPAVTKPAAP